jgi:hypothetical protein
MAQQVLSLEELSKKIIEINDILAKNNQNTAKLMTYVINNLNDLSAELNEVKDQIKTINDDVIAIKENSSDSSIIKEKNKEIDAKLSEFGEIIIKSTDNIDKLSKKIDSIIDTYCINANDYLFINKNSDYENMSKFRKFWYIMFNYRKIRKEELEKKELEKLKVQQEELRRKEDERKKLEMEKKRAEAERKRKEAAKKEIENILNDIKQPKK